MADATRETILEPPVAICPDRPAARVVRGEIRDEVRAVKARVAGPVRSELDGDATLAAPTVRGARIERRPEPNDT